MQFNNWKIMSSRYNNNKNIKENKYYVRFKLYIYIGKNRKGWSIWVECTYPIEGDSVGQKSNVGGWRQIEQKKTLISSIHRFIFLCFSMCFVPFNSLISFWILETYSFSSSFSYSFPFCTSNLCLTFFMEQKLDYINIIWVNYKLVWTIILHKI